MTHSLLLATEEEREWMIDREGGVWFDWQNGEWKDLPDNWKKASNWEIVSELMTGLQAGRTIKISRKAALNIIKQRKQREKEYLERLAIQRKKNRAKYNKRPAPDVARFLEIAKQINKPK